MIYLDNAATSFPKPECVMNAVNEAMRKLGGNPGRSAHAPAATAAAEVYLARVRAAQLFGARAENVIFTYNTTYAINIALKSSYIYGTHILISDLEHNSVLRPCASVTGNSFASYSIFDSAVEKSDCERAHAVISSIRSKMRPLTKTIVCTSRSNVTGTPMPIREIGEYCRANDIFFIVDGAQSAGFDDIDVERDNIDALCVPGHKGLSGPGGTGMVIYSSHGVDSARVGTFIEGGNGVSSLDINMPEMLPEKLESGTLDVAGIAGLNAAIQYIDKIGIKRIAEHETDLIRRAHMALCFNDKVEIYSYRKDSPILLFNIKGKDCEQTAAELDAYGICVRAGYHCSPLAHKRIATPVGGAVRVSVGYTNTEIEIDEFVNAVKKISNL